MLRAKNSFTRIKTKKPNQPLWHSPAISFPAHFVYKSAKLSPLGTPSSNDFRCVVDPSVGAPLKALTNSPSCAHRAKQSSQRARSMQREVTAGLTSQAWESIDANHQEDLHRQEDQQENNITMSSAFHPSISPLWTLKQPPLQPLISQHQGVWNSTKKKKHWYCWLMNP